MLQAVQNQGPNFVIGIIHEPKVAGLYFWGYQVSAQAVFLLSIKMQQVLFPSLSRLNLEPDRQFAAFRKALGIINTFVLPVCVIQIILAGPVIHLVFGERWQGAIPVIQWLSVGMAAVSLQVLGVSMLMARGHFATLTFGFTVSVGLVLSGSLVGSFLGLETAIACCTALGMILGSWFLLGLACRSVGQKTWPVLGELALPAALALGAGAFGWFLIAAVGGSLSVQIMVGLAGFCLVYGAGGWLWLGEEIDEFIRLIHFGLLKRKYQ
jgi:O-antigen/teichoic acid export membrane protein